jgi:hypothetical protein
MKNLKGMLAVSAAVIALTGVAMASETSYEYYAHPTLFGSDSQVTVEAGLNNDRAYTVGEKKEITKNQVIVKGKDKVAVDSWVKDVMDILKTNTTEKVFNPNMPILRSELAVVLAEGLSIPTAQPKYQYLDITSDYWAKAWIDKVLQENVMIGYPDRKFRPDQPITKAEVFATLAQLIDIPTAAGTELPSFKGYTMQQIPDWAIAPTKEVMASTLLEEVPEPAKVASEKYLSKSQVAYLVGALRQNYLLNGGATTAKAAKYTPAYVSAVMDERVDAKHANIGETFTATTTKAVTINGKSFAAGAKVIGEVVEVNRPGFHNPGYIKVKFNQIKDSNNCVDLPKNVTEATSKCFRRVNPIARFFAAPFSAAGRVLGVAGRSGAAALNVAGNGTERLGDNWSNTFADGLSLKGKPAVKNFGRGFVTVGKGAYDICKLAVSGTFGVVYEFTDEVVYLVLPSASANSSLNPNEEIMIVY